MIVPTLCVGMHFVTLRVTVAAERPDRRYHAERGNDQQDVMCSRSIRMPEPPHLCIWSR